MWMCTPSKTGSASSSTFMPSERKCRRKRPDCDAPVASAKSTRPASGLPFGFVRAPQPRHGVANREEPGADDRAARGAVHDLVDAAGFESAVERNVVGIDEPPRRAVDRRSRRRRGGRAPSTPRRRCRGRRADTAAAARGSGRARDRRGAWSRSRPAAAPARGPDPAIGAPSSPSASGAASPTMPGRRTTSHCHPDHATRVATPEQEAVAGFDAIGQPGHRERADAQRQARRRSPVRDAVEQPAISRRSDRRDAARSRSESKVTNPFASRDARSRSTIRRLASVVGSTAYRSTARTTSYGPVSPNDAPSSYGATTTDSIPQTATPGAYVWRAVRGAQALARA